MIIWSKINDKKNPKPRKEYCSGEEEIILEGDESENGGA